MSQQSLSSKTITKRNAAQSSVIFSVVVAVITLGVIATVAYVDITEEIDSVSAEKSIPERIAEQKVRAEANRKEAELLSQAKDLVITMDKRVDDLNQLEQKVKQINEQLNFVSTKLEVSVDEPKAPIATAIKAVQTSDNSSLTQQQNFKSILDQNYAAKINAGFHGTAAGEVFFDISWLFQARGNMGLKQDFTFNQQANSQNNWNAKTF